MTSHRRDQSRPHRRHGDASDPPEAPGDPGDSGTACDPGQLGQLGQPGTAGEHGEPGAPGDPGDPGGRGEPDGHGAPRRTRVRIVVVGAGPHGLAAALHLVAADPGIRDGLVVVDPVGGWLRAWDERFARMEIEHLRSPGVHHPGCDPYGLVGWTERNGFGSSRRWRYELPDTVAFRAYCRHLVAEADLDEHVVPTRARRLDAGPDTSTVVLGDGTELVADHVVVATDPARRSLPTWVADALPVPADTMAHAADVDLRALDGELDGRRVVVLGGGLTAGHLACGALARGASVTVLARRPLREQMFDTDPGWLGPKHLDRFHRLADPGRRVRVALAARDGGSMPPWMARRLRAASDRGGLRVLAPARVCGAQRSGEAIRLVLADETRVDADRLWLATGTRPDVTADRLTTGLLVTHPVAVHDGWPALDADLRWPGTNVHLLGRLAMPVLGPAAGNLWGARVGAARIAETITGGTPPPTGSPLALVPSGQPTPPAPDRRCPR